MTFSPILTSKILHGRSEAAVMHTEWSCAAARVYKRASGKMKGGGGCMSRPVFCSANVF